MRRVSSQVTHIGNVRLTDLAFASQFSIWGFRAVATGHHRCPIVTEGYRITLFEHSETGYQALQDFVFSLAQTGRRKVKISMSGCLKVTADELSILSAIHAAQTRQQLLLESNIKWLLGGQSTPAVYEAITKFGSALSSAGLHVSMPDIHLQSCEGKSANQNQPSEQYGSHNVRTLH